MKKLAVLLCLVYVSSDAFGIYSAWAREEFRKNADLRPIRRTTEASGKASSSSASGHIHQNRRRTEASNEASSSYASKRIHQNKTRRDSKNHHITENSDERAGIDPKIKKKIRNFARNLKSNIYGAKQIEDALMERASLSVNPENISARDLISPWTLAHWYTKLGLNRICKYRKNSDFEQKLINAIDQNVEWKNFHKSLGKRRNETINALRKLQEKGQVGSSLNEETKTRLIQDFREKLITNKGLARKYNLKESEIYLVIHEARINKKDLSVINLKWRKEYKNRQSIPEKQKKVIVKDYNKGLLTVLGICVKHGISQSVAQALLYRDNDENIKRRHGKQHKRDEELVSDILTKPSHEIEQKYGYTSIYVDEMKRFVKQWNLLTDGQKMAFSRIMRKKALPSKYVLSSIKRSSDRNANEKFDKILFASISSREDVMEKYGMSRKTVNRLIREMEFWKVLSKKERAFKR